MIYFEDARLEFFGVPLAYLPYFSAPDPTVKRKTGVLMPSYSTSSVYGLGVSVPYYWALAPDYDLDLHADDHDQARAAAAGRMASAAAQWRLQHPRHRASSSSTRSCLSDGVTRRAIATGAAASKRRANSIFRTNGSGAGTARCCPTRTISTTTACSGTCRQAICSRSSTPDYALVPALSRGPRRSQLLRRAHDVLLWPLASRRSGPASGRASGDRPRLCLQEPDIRRRIELPQQSDQSVPRYRQLRPDLADRR